ncbi:alpha-1A adrenergic receptor-like [Hydractinia symbiolongicarpus]|uniref:alpha-1A adrenergic receptor-like n=1 Tax=Hydractinia symbiolongicarpus TaxID=13093 RepID=UPI00254CB2EF|nr:alpha-1A adrenergic receptor-like [Hydractinia symbiolongicarpus]
MDCEIRLSLLRPPLSLAFGVMFVVVSVLIVAPNTLVLIMLYRGNFTRKSYKFFVSLSLSDGLCGLTCAPLLAWQLFHEEARVNCHIELIRRYFVMLFSGSSGLMLAVIAYDRYISLTKLNNYDLYMTKIKFRFLVAICWICPALIPLLRFAGRMVYMSLGTIIFLFGSCSLFISYYCVGKAVKQHKICMKKYQRDFTIHHNSRTTISKNFQVSNDGYQNIEKTVLLLIICHLICILPMFCWGTLEMLSISYQVVDLKTSQTLHVVSLFMIQFSSCVDPVIYFLKNPRFRKGLYHMVKCH